MITELKYQVFYKEKEKNTTQKRLKTFPNNKASLFVFLISPDEIEKTEYSLDPGSSFPQDRGDVVTLERVSFGRIAHD